MYDFMSIRISNFVNLVAAFVRPVALYLNIKRAHRINYSGLLGFVKNCFKGVGNNSCLGLSLPYH